MKQFKAKEGTNFLRIIPPENPEEYFGRRIFVHYNMGPNNDAYMCPKMMLGKTCVICDRREKLLAAEADKDVLKALSCFPPRYFFIAVDVSSKETEEEGPQLYDAPQTVNEEIIGLSKNRKTGELIDISDPDTGKVLIFDRKGTKALNTKYSTFELDDGEPIPDEWLNIPTFDELMHFGTDDEMLESMGAAVKERAAEPDPAVEAPRSRRSVREEVEAPPPEVDRRRGAAPAPEPEPEKESSTEAPTRRRRGAAAPVEDTPPEGEPVAEEAPTRRRRGAAAETAPSTDDAGGGDEPSAGDVRSRVRERLAARRG